LPASPVPRIANRRKNISDAIRKKRDGILSGPNLNATGASNPGSTTFTVAG